MRTKRTISGRELFTIGLLLWVASRIYGIFYTGVIADVSILVATLVIVIGLIAWIYQAITKRSNREDA